jgi:hypothetical protein
MGAAIFALSVDDREKEEIIMTYEKDRFSDHGLKEPPRFSNYVNETLILKGYRVSDTDIFFETNKGERIVKMEDINVIDSKKFEVNGEIYFLYFDNDSVFTRQFEYLIQTEYNLLNDNLFKTKLKNIENNGRPVQGIGHLFITRNHKISVPQLGINGSCINASQQIANTNYKILVPIDSKLRRQCQCN